MGRFANLLPDIEKRKTVWKEVFPKVKELVDEVNDDFFNGGLEAGQAKSGIAHPVILNPYYGIVQYSNYSLCVGLAQDDSNLRVAVWHKDGGVRFADTTLENLENCIRDMLVWFLDCGIRASKLRKYEYS